MAPAISLALALMGCTLPSSVEYKCEGGRKIAVQTKHGLSLFGFEIIETRHDAMVAGECDRDVDVDVHR